MFNGSLRLLELWAVQAMEASHSRNCQTLGVPRQSRGFTRDYYPPRCVSRRWPYSRFGHRFFGKRIRTLQILHGTGFR